jgi:glycosyltransferase involved in cell wall biosynthesis
VQIDHHFAPGCAVLPRVRNRLVSAALALSPDWIVFIDDDIAWKTEDFFKLFKHGVDMVSAAPAKRHARWDEAPAAVAGWAIGPIEEAITPAGRLWKADNLATGFLAIRANVFDRLELVTVQYFSQGDPSNKTRNWFWFDLIEVDGRLEDEGEDYNFCRKFREVGGLCWIDPDIRVEHYEGAVCHDFCMADAEIKKEDAA